MIQGSLWYCESMERYRMFSHWCMETYGHKLYRIALDAGMTCPNRDGTLDSRGCIFCDAGGSGDFATKYDGQKIDMSSVSYVHHPELGSGYFIAYFQAYTNTYAPLKRLQFLFSSALSDPLFAGISIATRPDCLGPDVISLLDELKKEYPSKFIWIELGLQTMHEDTARWMRRGYPLSVFEQAVNVLQMHGFPVIVHVILGLPGEDKQRVLETVRYLNRFHLFGVKYQLLHVLKNTDLETLYEEGKIQALTLDAYVDLVAACIASTDPSVILMRLSGDGDPEELIAPLWSLAKRQVLNRIQHELKTRNITQGCWLPL